MTCAYLCLSASESADGSVSVVETLEEESHLIISTEAPVNIQANAKQLLARPPGYTQNGRGDVARRGRHGRLGGCTGMDAGVVWYCGKLRDEC